MNILQVSAVKNWGGGEGHIESLCLELNKSYPEINSIILCVKNGLFHKKLENSELKFHTASLKINLDIRFAIKIGQLCKRYEIDIIHIHDPSAIALTIIADKLYNLPPFIFSKKTSFPIKKKKLTLYKYNYPKIKKIICVSNETKRIAAESIINKEKLMTIYDGTSLENKSSTTPFLIRKKYELDSYTKVIGVIGNHIRAKHYETLIQVVDTIINKKNRKDFFFIQIGNFTDRTENLVKSIEELKLNNHIKLTGFLSEASNFIPQFDALLITSQSEGLPLVIYESFYHKTPVISTNVGGISEIIEDNINGLLAPKHDYLTLAEKIIFLFENPELIESFTQISYNKLINNYTTSKMTANTVKAYQSILSNGH
jgi:glycosyltransferase involved in cell wall biosynthesis